jgi:molecular chaperone DnaK (HSP70)
MGELDNYGLQFFINGKPIHYGDFGCGMISKPSPNDAERFAKVKTEMDAMAEKYKPIADKLVEEIYKSSPSPMHLLNDETTQQINEAFENIRKTMEKDFPMAFAKRKARKHYKPKFTL